MSIAYTWTAHWVVSGTQRGPDLPVDGVPFTRAESHTTGSTYATSQHAVESARSWWRRQTDTDGAVVIVTSTIGTVRHRFTVGDVTLVEHVAVIAATAPLGTPTAAKRGRNQSRWPYVPIVRHTGHDGQQSYTTQIRGRAFATRDEAVADAAAYIERGRAALAADLLNPRHRALREHWGLPREIPSRWNPDTLSHVYDPNTAQEATS